MNFGSFGVGLFYRLGTLPDIRPILLALPDMYSENIGEKYYYNTNKQDFK